jgi:hypothetical protein
VIGGAAKPATLICTIRFFARSSYADIPHADALNVVLRPKL